MNAGSLPNSSRTVAESIPIEHETIDRVVRTLVVAVPPAALAWAAWMAWGGSLQPHDLLVLAITYTLTGMGITVGYHRLFTHRSFKTSRPLRALFAVLGSMAVEGPVIEWVSTHRKHHCFSDKPGDPHSPHVDHAVDWRGALRGLGHAHVGWMFRGKDMANPDATRGTCSQTATCGSSAAHFRSGWCWGLPCRSPSGSRSPERSSAG